MVKLAAKTLKSGCKVFLIALLIMFFVREFFVQSYVVSTVQMEASVLNGDYVLVNKLAYGIRMPITPLSIPFSFDSVAGFRSYSSSIQLGYNRFFASHIQYNDVVVFNNPSETDKPLDKRSLCISRCVAIAGDSIQRQGFDFKINGKSYVVSPDRVLEFSYPRILLDSLKDEMKKLKLNAHGLRQDTTNIYLTLNRYEAFLLNQNLGTKLEVLSQDSANFKLLIPKQGQEIVLTKENIPFYRPIILSEKGSCAHFEKDQLFINGERQQSFVFENNYYWLLSDNVDASLDSRHLGLISEREIIGKASVVLFSVDPNTKIRWNRILFKIS